LSKGVRRELAGVAIHADRQNEAVDLNWLKTETSVRTPGGVALEAVPEEMTWIVRLERIERRDLLDRRVSIFRRQNRIQGHSHRQLWRVEEQRSTGSP
jgi:hypothetical protein